MKLLKLITQKEKELLIKHGFMINTQTGYCSTKKIRDYKKNNSIINKNKMHNFCHVGYYKSSSGTMYIEDWYADKSKTLK